MSTIFEPGGIVKKLFLAVFASALVSPVAFANPTGSKPHPSLKQSDIKYAQPFGADGPSVGVVDGKWGNGKPWSGFIIFKAGQQGVWHTHTDDYDCVVLKGTYTEQQKGEPMADVPAGSWLHQPSVQPHRNGCKAGGDDCLVYIYFNHRADAVITDENGKPLPPKSGDK